MTTNTGGGLVGQLKIDPVTGKPYTSSGKVSGTDINSVRGGSVSVSVDPDAETPEAAPITTVVVQGTPGRSIASAAIVGNNLVLTFTDGTTLDAGNARGPAGSGAAGNDGEDGPGFVSAFINGTGHLILTKTDATTSDVGKVTGADGTDGTDGTNGKTILSGAVDPTTEGTNGDFYLNTATLMLFGPKTSGAWAAGVSIKGADGLNGKTVLNGTAAPTGGIGVNGDFYINTTTLELYGPKGTPSAGWNTPVSLKGADGTNGTNGVNGLMPTLPGFEELVSLDEADLSEGETYLVLGRDAPYDGLGGIFAWDATSTETDDGVNIVALDPSVATGRFKAVQKLFKPVVAGSVPADATDEATAVTLVNALKQILIDNGFID